MKSSAKQRVLTNIQQGSVRQRGHMMLVAIFVVVVMGVLALNLGRIQWSNQDTLTREALGNQAWFLAGSANEWVKSQKRLFSVDTDRETLDRYCQQLNQDDWLEKQQAMAALTDGVACRPAVITCILPALSIPDELAYHRVSSSVACGDNDLFQVHRRQEIFLIPLNRPKKQPK